MSEKKRLFVCVNQKSGVGEAVVKALKKELKVQLVKSLLSGGERHKARVQSCSCLDLCKQCKKGPGAALIVYPEGTVYGNVQASDAAELVAEHLGRGRIVARLQAAE